MHSVIEAIETANPPLSRSQDHAASFMGRVESLPDGIRKRIPAIYGRSAIERRYSCVPDFAHFEPERFEFFPKDWSLSPAPSTEFRNEWYRRSIIPLMEAAARKAISSGHIEPEDVTHIITVSCTGFFAPGPDVEMVKRLGLSASTHRTNIGFMGCFAAFNALRVADAFCRSTPGAVVLIVCAELCTLHFQVDDSLESAVINALFSDGAASAIMRSRADSDPIGGLVYKGSHSVLDDDSMGDMTWAIGDTGFIMGLSSRVPAIISKRLPAFVEKLSEAIGGIKNVGAWAIHPGGRAIVDKAQEVLDLEDDDVRHSLSVLRDYGNMSSPTILFVLKRIMEHGAGNGGPGGLAMAFGPGLTLEGAAFELA